MRTNDCAGVTLIELMIGLAIVALMLTMGLPSISTWMANAQLRSATESIQSGLQLARGEAVRRNALVGFTMAGPDSSWAVDVTGTGVPVQSRSAAEGTPSAQIATTDALIIFNGLGRANLAAPATIQVTNPTGGVCKPGGDMNCLNVTVAVGGQVKMCDPIIVAVSDTRRC